MDLRAFVFWVAVGVTVSGIVAGASYALRWSRRTLRSIAQDKQDARAAFARRDGRRFVDLTHRYFYTEAVFACIITVALAVGVILLTLLANLFGYIK